MVALVQHKGMGHTVRKGYLGERGVGIDRMAGCQTAGNWKISSREGRAINIGAMSNITKLGGGAMSGIAHIARGGSGISNGATKHVINKHFQTCIALLKAYAMPAFSIKHPVNGIATHQGGYAVRGACQFYGLGRGVYHGR